MAKACKYNYNNETNPKGKSTVKPGDIVRVKYLNFETGGDSYDLAGRTYASIQLPIIVSSMVLNDLKVNQKLNANEILFADGTSLMSNPMSKGVNIKTIDIKALHPGIYHYRIFVNDKVFSGKILKTN